MTTFDGDMAIMIPFNDQINLFWKQFESQIMPLNELLINTITDLINNRKVILTIPNEKQKTYDALLQIYQEDLSQQLEYEPVAMLDARLSQANHILAKVNNSTTLNKIINAILAYYMQQTNNNQLSISPEYQSAIFKTANDLLTIDMLHQKYDAKTRKFVDVKSQ